MDFPHGEGSESYIDRFFKTSKRCAECDKNATSADRPQFMGFHQVRLAVPEFSNIGFGMA